MKRALENISELSTEVRVATHSVFLLGESRFVETRSRRQDLTRVHNEAIKSFGPRKHNQAPESFAASLKRFLHAEAADFTIAQLLLERLAEANGELMDLTKRRYKLSWSDTGYRNCDTLPDGSEPSSEAIELAFRLAAKLGLWTFIKSEDPDSAPWFAEQLSAL